MPRDDVFEWASKIPSSFSDPFTGLTPKTERELTGVLSIRHQFRLIDWSRVPLIQVSGGTMISTALSIIAATDLVVSEYPLFSRVGHETDRWGRMMPDLIFTDQNLRHMTLVEAKIDSHFTFSDNPPDGQVSRYLEYLKSNSIGAKSLVIICPPFNTAWYSERILAAAKHLDSKIPICIMEWDAIFAANRTEAMSADYRM